MPCLRGALALGGGVRVDDPSAQSVRATFPYDDEDENPRPEDGWAGQIKNDGDRTLSARVYMTCG